MKSWLVKTRDRIDREIGGSGALGSLVSPLRVVTSTTQKSKRPFDLVSRTS